METIQPAKYVLYLRNVAIWQNRQKLVTSIPGHNIRPAGGSPQLFSKYSQYVVSDSMAVVIVYLFKAIEIERNHGQWSAVPLTSRSLFL